MRPPLSLQALDLPPHTKIPNPEKLVAFDAEYAPGVDKGGSPNDTVCQLYLGGNSIKDPGAAQLVECLKVNNSITHLNIGANAIKDHSILAISTALCEKNQKLAAMRNELVEERAAHKAAVAVWKELEQKWVSHSFAA